MAKNATDTLRNLVIMLSLAFSKLMKAAEPADWQKFTFIDRTKNASRKFAWLSKFPALEDWTGTTTYKHLAKHDYSVPVKIRKSAAEIRRDEFEDEGPNVYVDLPSRAKEIVDVARNEALFGLLDNPAVCHDGQNFFDTDHPLYPEVDGSGSPTTYSNLLGSPGSNPAWVVLDTSRSIKPLVMVKRDEPEFKGNKNFESFLSEEVYRMYVRVREGAGVTLPQLAVKSYKDLDETNFQEALTALQEMKTDGNRLMHIKPSLLIAPPSLEAAARKLIEAQNKSGGESNIMYKRVDLLVSSYFEGK